MSFAAFRKYQKPLLWFAIIFSVLVFATFSGFGDIEQMLERDATAPAGRFRLQPTGEQVSVPIEEFLRTRQTLAILKSMSSRERLDDLDVWTHIIHVADARAAGLKVAEAELSEMSGQFARALLGGQPLTPESYRNVWTSFRLPTARDFEAFVGELLLVDKWVALRLDQAAVVNAEDVFLRWRVDHERFDLTALVFPDVAPEDVPEPAPETLHAWWDGLSETERSMRFKEPRKVGLVYAWTALDGSSSVPEEALADLDAPDEEEVLRRFAMVQPERFPEQETAEEATLAALSRELLLVRHVERLSEQFEAGEARDADSFAAAMSAAGLSVERPEGLFDSEGLAAVPEIGNAILPFWLERLAVGGVHFGQPFGAQDDVHVVLLTQVEPARPRTFEEAGADVLAAWREAQRDRLAREWREAVRAAAAALPAAEELLAPLRAAGLVRIEEELVALSAGTEGEGLDDAALQEQRRARIALLERNELQPRLAEFEAQVREQVPLPESARRIELAAVPRSYAVSPDPADEAGSLERFIKSSPAVFQLAVGALSEPLRHASSASSVVVLVTSRQFPEHQDMAADAAGLTAARQSLGFQRRSEAASELNPERVAAAHELQLPAADSDEAQDPGDSGQAAG